MLAIFYFLCLSDDISVLNFVEPRPWCSRIFIIHSFFIHLWLGWIFIAAHRLFVTARELSLVVGVTLQLWCMSLSLQWFLLLWSTGSRQVGYSSCSALGLAGPWHWDLSSWTRDWLFSLPWQVIESLRSSGLWWKGDWWQRYLASLRFAVYLLLEY